MQAATGGVIKKGVDKYFAKFTENTCVEVFFSEPATLLRKRPWHRCFSVNSANFLWTPFLLNNFGRLLLEVQSHIQPENHNTYNCFRLMFPTYSTSKYLAGFFRTRLLTILTRSVGIFLLIVKIHVFRNFLTSFITISTFLLTGSRSNYWY